MTERQLSAQHYLERYAEAQRRVRWCQEQYDREAYLLDTIRSPSDNDGMPHGNGIGRPTESKALKLSEKAMDIHKAKQAAREVMREIFTVAYNVGGIEGDVLIERYIKLKEWEDVYAAVNYSERQTFRYHNAGLDKVADMLDL